LIRRAPALLLALALVAVLADPALAASPAPAAQDVIAGPPTDNTWQTDGRGTGTVATSELFGSSTPIPKGYAEAYRHTWNRGGTNVWLYDTVERFTSAFWAALEYTSIDNAAATDTSHATYSRLPSLTNYAYETTDPPDSQGYIFDSIAFVQGGYFVYIEVAEKVAVPREVVLDQATRQLARLPSPAAEYSSIISGVVIGGAAFLVVLAALIGAVVLLVRRGRPAVAGGAAFADMPYQPAAAWQLTQDGRHWWDRRAWRDAALSVPPGAPRSPDGSLWWDGARWRPIPGR
jgi:hypothetical protein